MGEPKRIQEALSFEAYLNWEKEQENRFEYAFGEVFAMAGTSDTHNDLVFNITNVLKNATNSRKCNVYFENVKLELVPQNLYVYPDVMLTCDKRDKLDHLVKKYPSLIVEVLSTSTEARDRGQKFSDYLKLPSLAYYILVSQYQHKVEVFGKLDSGGWKYRNFETLSDTISLEDISLELSVQDIYENISLNS